MRKSDMPLRVRLFFLFSSLVTVGIGAILLVRGWNLRDLYRSSEVRGQLTAVFNGLRDDHGLPRSFFVIESLSCSDDRCVLRLREQPNLVTAHAPLQRIHVTWSRAEPTAYAWTYVTDH